MPVLFETVTIMRAASNGDSSESILFAWEVAVADLRDPDDTRRQQLARPRYRSAVQHALRSA